MTERSDGTASPPASSPGEPAPSARPPAAADALQGSVVRLRKPHACGGWEWSVLRVGAEVALRCRTCGRSIRLPREQFMRRARRIDPA